MRVRIHPTYRHLRAWIETIPEIFSQTGEVIYDARNQIRVMTGPNGERYCVKRYCRPAWYNRIIYTLVRTPKSKRAYVYARRLTRMDIATPAPVAHIEMGTFFIGESYLVTEMSPLGHRMYEAGQQHRVIEDREGLLRAFARMTADMHERGAMHLDYSPGNILYDRVDGEWQFAIVDINRMYFGPVSEEQGCANFARLWGDTAMFEILADEYARARNINKETALGHMLEARRRFWKNKHPHKDQYRD